MQKKGLGESSMIHGPYILHLGNSNISLIKDNTKDKINQITFFVSLVYIIIIAFQMVLDILSTDGRITKFKNSAGRA